MTKPELKRIVKDLASAIQLVEYYSTEVMLTREMRSALAYASEERDRALKAIQPKRKPLGL